jgi:hypothetical protein
MKAFRALWLILIAMYVMVAAPATSEAASAPQIDAKVDATIRSFESQIRGAS